MNPKTKWQLVLLVGLLGYAQRDKIKSFIANKQTSTTSVVDVAGYFHCWAEIVRNDKGIIKTNDDWRTAYRNASELLMNTTDYKKIPGLDVKISNIIDAAISLSVVGLDQKNESGTTYRVALANALDEVSLLPEIGGKQ